MTPHVDVHPGRGSYLLLVHGFLSSRAQWIANLAALGAICRPVTLELWGHGRSPAPENPAAYTLEAYIDQFEALRARLGEDRWLICGQSFGAGLTLQYALHHPERIIGQVFTNSVSALSPPDPDAAAGSSRADAIEAGGRAAIAALPFHPRQARRFPDPIKQALMADAEQASPSGIANAIRITGPQLSVAAALCRTRVPTLLVNGVWERAFQPLRDRAVTALPGLEVADLDAGHSVNIEEAEGFNRAVGRFVERFRI